MFFLKGVFVFFGLRLRPYLRSPTGGARPPIRALAGATPPIHARRQQPLALPVVIDFMRLVCNFAFRRPARRLCLDT